MKNKALPFQMPSGTARSTLALSLAVIVVWIAAQAGVAVAVPPSTPAKSDARGSYLGVYMQELTEGVRKGLDLKVEKGVLISEVVEGSPASESGLREGDVIVEFDGKSVDSPAKLKELVEAAGVGKKVKIRLMRDDKPKVIRVTLGERPEEGLGLRMPQPPRIEIDRNLISRLMPGGRLGVRVSEINNDLAAYFGVDEGKGVLVLEVEDESTAKETGVKAGDVIVKVGDSDVHSVRALQDAVRELEMDKAFAVTVVRHKKRMELKGKMKEDRGRWFEGGWLDEGPGGDIRKHVVRLRDGDLRREMDNLRKELENIREEIKKLKSEKSSL